MLRRIAPCRAEIMDVHARFGIAQDSKPAPEALSLQADIREKVVMLAEHLATEVEPSRELSLALTHLEEALMWAGKAVFLGDADAYERVEPKDERIVAWEAIIGHPIFKECFNTEGTLLDAVRNRLVDLYEMEQTVNELKGEDAVTTEAATPLSTVPNLGIRLEALKLVLSYGCEGLTPEAMIEAAEKFAVWVEGR